MDWEVSWQNGCLVGKRAVGPWERLMGAMVGWGTGLLGRWCEKEKPELWLDRRREKEKMK